MPWACISCARSAPAASMRIPILPDFMVFLNWTELPVYWYGFQIFPYAHADGAAGARARSPSSSAGSPSASRVTGVYLSIITQALTFALMLGFFRNNFGFGGNNGLTDFKDILGFNVQAPGTRAALFAIVDDRAAARLRHLPRHRHLEARQGAGRDPRRREPHAVPRLPCGVTTSCSSSHCRPAWPASPARSTFRRSASSIRASSRPPTRSRR